MVEMREIKKLHFNCEFLFTFEEEFMEIPFEGNINLRLVLTDDQTIIFHEPENDFIKMDGDILKPMNHFYMTIVDSMKERVKLQTLISRTSVPSTKFDFSISDDWDYDEDIKQRIKEFKNKDNK